MPYGSADRRHGGGIEFEPEIVRERDLVERHLLDEDLAVSDD